MSKILLLTVLAGICVVISALPDKGGLKIRGGVRKLEGDDVKDAEEALTFSLEKISAGEEGPHYKLGKINSATKQPVAGSLYRIDADIIDTDNEDQTKNCQVKIWSQPWLENGIEVTFDCKDEEPLTRHHSA